MYSLAIHEVLCVFSVSGDAFFKSAITSVKEVPQFMGKQPYMRREGLAAIHCPLHPPPSPSPSSPTYSIHVYNIPSHSFMAYLTL